MDLLSKEENSMEISRRMAFVISGLGLAGAAALTLGAAASGSAGVVVAPQKVLHDGDDSPGGTSSLGSPGSTGNSGATGSPGGPGGLGGDSGQVQEKEVKAIPSATETVTPTPTPTSTG
jgi:hypothetical protein